MPRQIYTMPHEKVLERVRGVASLILHDLTAVPHAIYGVPRGGVSALYALLAVDKNAKPASSPTEAHAIIADVIDTGATLNRFKKEFPDKPFYALLDKRKEHQRDWIIFPWEGTTEQSVEDIPLRLLQFIGEDVHREGLKDTPTRFLKAWEFWTRGYQQDPREVFTTFEDGAQHYDQMIVVKDIPVWSHCEHHLAPFFGVAHIAYIPRKRIVGLSKFSRLVDIFAHRLQVQERLTDDIADAMQYGLSPLGVGVVLQCRHSCMESRGVQREGMITTTSSLRGAFLKDNATRTEFLRYVRGD